MVKCYRSKGSCVSIFLFAQVWRALVAADALADNTAAAHYGLEVQFFDVKSDHMIWTAKTKTFDAGDLDDLVIKFADIMIDDSIAKGVISE